MSMLTKVDVWIRQRFARAVSWLVERHAFVGKGSLKHRLQFIDASAVSTFGDVLSAMYSEKVSNLTIT